MSALAEGVKVGERFIVHDKQDVAATMIEDCWTAHDHPERPLAYGAWLCSCDKCSLALKASALRDPDLRLVVKRSCGRNIVTPCELLAVGADFWLDGADDYVREVFVAR